MGFYAFKDMRDALTAKQMVVERRARSQTKETVRYAARKSSGGGSASVAVAVTTEIIPARVGKTPGGPVDVVIQESDAGGDFTAGDTVQIYSWVKTPSPDPADQPNGELYIFASRDADGMNWYHAVDCEEPPPAAVEVPDAGTIPSDGTEVVYVQ